MPKNLYMNGAKVQTPYYNGAKVKKVYFNNVLVYSGAFEFTYTGAYTTEGDFGGNFVIRFQTSGTLTITDHGDTGGSYDLFAVGGGGGGGWYYDGGQGISPYAAGGGGYTSTKLGVSLSGGPHLITVGAGGAYNTGGETSSFSSYLSAAGGTAAINDEEYYMPRYGGNGGSGGGAPYGSGGSDGSDSPKPLTGGIRYCGKGQGSTTREFGESTGVLYAGGGGGGATFDVAGGPVTGGAGGGGNGVYFYLTPDRKWAFNSPTPGAANTGGGGGGGGWYIRDKTIYGAAGGSGIVCIRNHR